MSDLTWDLGLTQKLVFSKIRLRPVEALASLNSVVDRMDHSRYHYHQVMTPWAETLLEAERTGDTFKILGWGITEDERAEHFEKAIQRSANVIACVHALHAVPDTLAYALYHCTDMTLPTGKRESDISVGLMKGLLALHPGGEPFRDLLEELTTDTSYDHLSALSNHAKHRSIIADRVFADATGKDPVPLRLTFGRFSYKGQDFAQQEALPLLQAEFDRINKIVMKCGTMVNEYLNSKPDRI